MRTYVRFKSSLFKPIKPEEEQVNPYVYGEELAQWIFKNIGKHGPQAKDFFGEDWGWMVVFGSKYPAWIGCGNVYGSDNEWLCFCEPVRSFTDRILRRPLPKELSALVMALDKLIRSEPGISDVEWLMMDKRGRESDHGNKPFDG